jgi:hypothetical protein
MYDNSEFTVTLGNNTLNAPSNTADFKGIKGGSYYLKVAKSVRGAQPSSTVMFEGYVSIPDNYYVSSVIDESGHFVIYKKLRNAPEAEHNYNCDCDCEACRNCKYKQHGSNQYESDWEHREISSRDFQDFLKVVRDRTFETTKMDFAKDGIERYYFNTDQVREVLGLFTFENNKLELAKLMYDKTCDKKNYFRLYDIFVFETNVTDLKDYIKNKGKQ